MLNNRDIRADINVDACIEACNIKDLFMDNLWLLYRVKRAEDDSVSDRRVRHLVDTCLANGCSVCSVEVLLKELAGLAVGHSRVERKVKTRQKGPYSVPAVLEAF